MFSASLRLQSAMERPARRVGAAIVSRICVCQDFLARTPASAAGARSGAIGWVWRLAGSTASGRDRGITSESRAWHASRAPSVLGNRAACTSESRPTDWPGGNPHAQEKPGSVCVIRRANPAIRGRGSTRRGPGTVMKQMQRQAAWECYALMV